METSSTWPEIERSESYLVCSMFEEATSLASSIIKKLRGDENAIDVLVEKNESELDDMLESAGMVFVQSLKGLGRTSEIVSELRLLFGSVAAIPVQVFLTGACFLVSESPCTDVQEFLEEFLSKWTYVDEGYYVCGGSGIANKEGPGNGLSLEVDKYLEVVELYVITLLATMKKDLDLAVSWVEKATLPVEKQQITILSMDAKKTQRSMKQLLCSSKQVEIRDFSLNPVDGNVELNKCSGDSHTLHLRFPLDVGLKELLRRLQSMDSSKVTSSMQASLQVDEHKKGSASAKEEKAYNGSLDHLEARFLANPENMAKDSVLKLSGQGGQCFWWFRTITLKFGNNRWVISNGNILLGCLALIIYYIMRRKQVNLKSFLKKQALTMKKALVDLWQLAFSYQVNPLAAVQSLPAATHGSR